MSTSSPSDPPTPEQSPALPPNIPVPVSGSRPPAAPKTPTAQRPAPTSDRAGDNSPPGQEWTELPELQGAHLRSLPRRRLTLPLILFVATCLSTFWVGAADWRPQMIE